MNDHWIGKLDGVYVEFHIPQNIKDDPMSFYNSEAGKKYREKSNELFNKINNLKSYGNIRP